jgi:hypothetical protein
MSRTPTRVLRVGVLQDGRLIEERFLRPRRVVTVGTDHRCTFPLPSDAGPARAPFFRHRGGGWYLEFDPQVRGKVGLDDRVLTLDAAIDHGVAHKTRRGWRLPITGRSRGKVVIAGTTFLFQLVDAPRRAAIQLPAHLRRGLFGRLDRGFGQLLLASAALQVAAVVFLSTVPQPARLIQDGPDRFRKVIFAAPTPKEAPEEVEPSDPAPEIAEAPTTKRAPVDRPPKKAAPPPTESPAQRLAAAAERGGPDLDGIRNKTIIGLVGAMGHGGSLVNSLSDGAAQVAVKHAFDGVDGMVLAQGPTTRDVRGGRPINKITRHQFQPAPSPRKVARGTKSEVKVSGRVDLKKAPPPVGDLTAQQFAKAVRGRVSQVKACYEKQLKRDPTLQGKVVVHVAIGPAGRATRSALLTNTTKNAALGVCVVSVLKRLKLPPSDLGGTANFPFVFAPSK